MEAISRIAPPGAYGSEWIPDRWTSRIAASCAYGAEWIPDRRAPRRDLSCGSSRRYSRSMVPLAPAVSDARSESSRNEHVAQSSNDGTGANADLVSVLCIRSRVDA